MMPRFATAFVIAMLLSSPALGAETTPSELTCADFKPTEDALRRFPDLVGACESVVERDGELYGKFTAEVRRASGSSVTLYLPATDHTFTIDPKSDARVLIGSSRVRPRDLARGQEIQIYLSASSLARPNVEEVTLVTDTGTFVEQTVAPAPTLPTTASPWPTVVLAGLGLLCAGGIIRYRRRAQTGV